MSYDWRKWLPASLTQESSISSSQATTQGPSSIYDWTQWLPKSFRQTEPVERPREISVVKDIPVFISYAREDFAKAKRLYEDLKEARIIPWLDKESLLPGQQWKTAIRGGN